MNRRGFLRTWSPVGLGLAVVLGLGGRGEASPQQGKKKRKPPDYRRDNTNRDGRNTIDGALWEFVGTQVSSGKEVRFRYRATNWVLHDLATGKVIGKTERIKDERARMTLNDGTPFPGQFDIKRHYHGHWSGRMKRDDADWVIKLTCLDR